MVKHTTEELKAYIEKLYAKIEPIARKDGVYRPLDDHFGKETPNGRDGGFCFSDYDGYHYCVSERGLLTTNIITQSLVEIVYLVLSSDLLRMASAYECRNRIDGQDFRRLMFQKELEYWNILGVEYRQVAEQNIRETLSIAPFAD